MSLEFEIPDEAGMQQLGKSLANIVCPPLTIYFHGQLGAGKTTLIRALLRNKGVTGAIKSPTFTVVEPYQIDAQHYYHFDLYRIANPDELELIGIRDYLQDNAVLLVEWPEYGGDALPAADISIEIEFAKSGRIIKLRATTTNAAKLLKKLASSGFK